MDESTTTGATPASDSGAPAQPESQETATAVQQTSTDESASKDTGESKETNTNDDLVKWASNKGLEINSDNPNEVKLAQMQREAEKKMHSTSQQSSELKNAVDAVIDTTVANNLDNGQVSALEAQVARLEVESKLNNFFAQNPDARAYDAEMAKLVTTNPNLAGAGLEAIYALARVNDLDSKEESIKKDGGREALQNVALKQQTAAPTGNATQPGATSSGITREEVRQRTQAGDTQWLFQHNSEIDKLYTPQ